jgi:dTMP kinase
MSKGLLVVLDGNDGSGKATQAKLLTEYLNERGTSAITIDFPNYDRNVFGTLIGECLAGKHGDFLHLDPKIVSALFAVDRFESSSAIRAHLARGGVVIADRYTSANQIHQGGKIADSEARKEFILWVEHMEHDVLGVPRPDVIVYLHVPLKISLELLSQKRTAKNASLSERQKDPVENDRAYLERSHETAVWLADHQSDWKVIDCVKEGAMRSREDIHKEIARLISGLL